MLQADAIRKISQEIHQKIIEIRRHLHMYPELSYQEVQTGKFIADQLKELGIPFAPGVAGNGLVAIIEGELPGDQVVALRADMDALPIVEANDVPYKSKIEGVMHACGHDVHTASLIGAASILQELRSHWGGTIKLLFQPAEEKLPGGASLMIKEGALDNPKPASIFGQHVHPPLEVGKVGMRPGMYMASADEIYVTIKGRGGHGALPHECVDTVLLASQVIHALQQVVSRKANPTIPSVLTFGKINSVGGATNVIPDEVYIEGTFRTMDEKWRFRAHQHIREIVNGTAAAGGGAADIRIEVGYPTLFNHEGLTARTRQYAEEYLGADNVVNLPIRLTAEDFAYYSQEMPACFYRLGTGNKGRGITAPVHTDTFDIDEGALLTGMGLMAWIAIQELQYKDTNNQSK